MRWTGHSLAQTECTAAAQIDRGGVRRPEQVTLAQAGANKPHDALRSVDTRRDSRDPGEDFMRRCGWFFATLALLSLALGSAPALAQDYPSRPVRIVVPFAPGAGNDLLGRIVATELTKRLGGQVFVENKPGAASQLGTDLVAKSPPDGYTLLWTASDGLSALPAVKASVPYKIPDDFVFIASLTRISFVIAVNPKVPAKTIQELIAYAKANPGKLNYGSAGLGSAPHLGLALFANAAKIDMVHVPFAGLGPALNAVMAGTVDLSLTTVPFAKPQEEAGTVRNLAITGTARDPLLPNVPTLQESGLPVTVQVFFGLLAPAHTPEPIVARLRKEIAEIAKEPAVIERLQTLGYPVAYLDGNGYRDTILKDLELWRGVAKAANIKIN
jgi:tripartite-type tricarboxylate transporter receptor subunit TctC